MKKIAVYFRDLPSVLETFASQNKMILRKDGVYEFGQIHAPRLSIEIEPTSPHEDRYRRRKLVDLLTELESNNQILGFSA